VSCRTPCTALVHAHANPSSGRQATANVKESLEWGTNIVGGVKPGVEGEHLGLPVFPSVKVVCVLPAVDWTC
jgi:succinyl-CoA synthetase alpha subunit